MKTLLKKYFFLGSILAFLFASCDKIEAPYVVIEQKDTTQCPAPEFPIITSHIKRVLVEDYTGHFCPNCPRAGVIAHDLIEQYQDTVVVLAVHAGYFAKVNANDPIWAYDFRTVAGTDWDLFFKVGAVGNPNGMVNRKGYPNNQVLSPSAWGNAVKNAVKETPLVDLQIITNFDAAKDNLCIHTKTTFLQPITNRNLNISVVITENKIVQAQKNSDPLVGSTPDILDFEHNHVMRGAVNGIWGSPILSSSETSSTPIVKSFPAHFTGFNLNTMAPDNCYVVAFVYDVDTKEVLQVTQVKATL